MKGATERAVCGRRPSTSVDVSVALPLSTLCVLKAKGLGEEGQAYMDSRVARCLCNNRTGPCSPHPTTPSSSHPHSTLPPSLSTSHTHIPTSPHVAAKISRDMVQGDRGGPMGEVAPTVMRNPRWDFSPWDPAWLGPMRASRYPPIFTSFKGSLSTTVRTTPYVSSTPWTVVSVFRNRILYPTAACID